jgi:hypothetical protein
MELGAAAVIKATGGSKDGTPMLILGLSRTNTDRLLAGQPIHVRADQTDPRLPALHIVLMGGETEQAIAAELGQHETGPEAPPRA